MTAKIICLLLQYENWPFKSSTCDSKSCGRRRQPAAASVGGTSAECLWRASTPLHFAAFGDTLAFEGKHVLHGDHFAFHAGQLLK